MSKNTPFRYDYVGSFLRPETLKKARRDFEEGKISKEELTKVEDDAILDLVEKQKKAGYAGKWHYTPEETRKAIGSWCRNACENRELRQRTYEAERTLIDGQGAARIAEILQTAGIEE